MLKRTYRRTRGVGAILRRVVQVIMRRLSSFRQSFTTDLQVLLETNKPTYFAGETVEGTVALTASQPIDSLKGLKVTVTGAEWATTKWADHLYSEHHNFFSCEVPIALFAGEVLEPGDDLSWSFSAQLPRDLPSTMQAGHECFWRVQYDIKAQVERSKAGGSMFQLRSSDESTVGINVLQPFGGDGAPPRPIESSSWNASTTISVRRCFCHYKGRISLGFKMDKTVLRRGEAFEVAVAILNASSVPITATKLKVQLVQHAKWTAENVSTVQKETIKGEVLQGPQACCVGAQFSHLAGGAAKATGSFEETSDAAGWAISQALESGECEKISLSVPWEVASETGDSSVLSQYFDLISSLQHFVRVRLETKLFVTNVELVCPITVVDGALKQTATSQ